MSLDEEQQSRHENMKKAQRGLIRQNHDPSPLALGAGQRLIEYWQFPETADAVTTGAIIEQECNLLVVKRLVMLLHEHGVTVRQKLEYDLRAGIGGTDASATLGGLDEMLEIAKALGAKL